MSEILRVMVADDDEAIARTVVLGLKTLGCAARSAPDGKTALEGMDGEPADVLLTDMRMGGMSGVELVRETLAEMYDPAVPFRQCADADTCRYCDFNVICKRG